MKNWLFILTYSSSNLFYLKLLLQEWLFEFAGACGMCACGSQLESSRSSPSNSSIRCESIQQYVSRNFSMTTGYHEKWIKVAVNSENAARGTSEEISIHDERRSSTTPARFHRSVLFMRFNVSTARIDGAFREH